MCDLVVAREGRVDGGPSAHHVLQHTEDDQVAHDHAHGAAHEGVDAAAVAAWMHVPADGPQRRRPLEHELPEEEHERARDVVAVCEERAVAGVRLLLGLHAADGEDRRLRLARQQVAAARAAVHEQAHTRGVTPLELGAVRRRRAGHHGPRLLLDPAEGGDVLVRPEQDPGLTGAGLRRQVGLPLDHAVRPLAQPARHVRGVAVAHRALQDGQPEPVDLEADDPRDVGLADQALPAGDAPGDLQRVRIVVVRPRYDLEHDRDGGCNEGRQERPPERVDLDRAVVEIGGDQQRPRVDDQHDQEAEDEDQRQPERGNDRRDDRVHDRDEQRRQKRAPEVRDVDVRDDPRGHEQRQRGHDPRGQQPQRLQPRTLRAPADGLCVGRVTHAITTIDPRPRRVHRIVRMG